VTVPGNLEAALKEQARLLGFDSIGIAGTLPFVREQAYLESRSANGIEPNPFEWPDLHARIDPREVLPDVESIVAVGMSYLMPDDDHAPSTFSGWFSRYCRGLDYHTVLDERMTQLARWLETRVPGALCRPRRYRRAAGPGNRRTSGPGPLRKVHAADHARSGDVDLSGRDLYERCPDSRRGSGLERVRELYALPGCLPNRLPEPLANRLDSLSRLPQPVQRRHSAGVSGADGQPPVWL
jgi:hypothetical protein